MEGDAKSGFAQHRQVVGSVAHGNGLREVHLLHLCDKLQQFCFSVSVHYLADVTSRQYAVVVHLQFVGVYIVDAVLALQELAEIRESAAENGYLISATFQHSHQAVHSLRDGHLLGDFLEHP